MFKKNISKFATHFSKTKGRLFKEKEDKNRSVFQRDRDEIIHLLHLEG